MNKDSIVNCKKEVSIFFDRRGISEIYFGEPKDEGFIPIFLDRDETRHPSFKITTEAHFVVTGIKIERGVPVFEIMNEVHGVGGDGRNLLYDSPKELEEELPPLRKDGYFFRTFFKTFCNFFKKVRFG